MKNVQKIDLGLTGYDELFMSTEERLDAKKPKVEAIPLCTSQQIMDTKAKIIKHKKIDHRAPVVGA